MYFSQMCCSILFTIQVCSYSWFLKHIRWKFAALTPARCVRSCSSINHVSYANGDSAFGKPTGRVIIKKTEGKGF